MLESDAILNEPRKEDTLVSGGFKRDEVFKISKENLNFLAALALPEIFTYYFPEIHLAVWDLLTSKVALLEDFTKLALGLPRGHAKTTLIKLFVLYCVLFSDRQFILVICASQDLAENFLSDIADMLDSPNIKSVFGDWTIARETNNAAIKKFSFMGRNIVLAASGKGAVRGLNIKHLRPDVIVMDDMQTREDSESPTQADKDLNWMFGTLMKLKAPKRCLYIFIGNMYHSQGCILRKLKKNKNWISFIIGAILADGKPIWPELHSLASLMAEFENDVSIGKPEIFFSEVMNDPEAGVSTTININQIPANPYEGDNVCLGHFVIIDVSTDKLEADDTAIGGFGIYGGDIVFEKLVVGSLNPMDTIKTSLQMAMTIGATLIAVEDVAYQSSLLFWFQQICAQYQITGIEFVSVSPRGQRKNHRIISWFKRILPSKRSEGNYEPPKEYISDEVRSKVVFQISQFKPSRRDNKDDILDVGAYAEQVVELYSQFIAIPSLASDPDFEKAKVLDVQPF